MAGWILVVGADSPQNWALGRGGGIWATKKSRSFKQGDRLFFWQAGAGLIANAVALSDAMTSVDYDYESLSWPDRWNSQEHRRENEIYRSIVEMRVLQETAPLPLSWSDVGKALHFDGGANTAPVQIGEASTELAMSWYHSDIVDPVIALEYSPSARRARSEPDQDAEDPADDLVVSILSAPRTIDPEVVGGARNRHNRIVRLIHEMLRSHGKRPIKPLGWYGEQPDVVWRDPPGFHIVEVKGITDLNEREQLRLGLGQVLRYRFISEKQRHSAQAWLVTDVEPADFLWIEICDSLNIRLWWPGSTSAGPGELEEPHQDSPTSLIRESGDIGRSLR